MLVIFSKRTGKIQSVCSGDLQRMETLYGDESVEYALIWDEIIVPDDRAVINNTHKFIVNTKTRELELRPEYAINVNKYKVAEQAQER